KLLIAKIQPGSPVEALGSIHVGDELTAVGNGRTGFMHSVTGHSVERAIELLAGPAGTCLRLSVIPHGQIVPTTHEVVRHEQVMEQGRRSFHLPASRTSNAFSCLVFRDECEVFDTETGHRVRSFSLNGPPIGGFSAVSQQAGRIAVIRRSPETRKPPRPRPKLTDEERVRQSGIGNIFGSIREDLAYAATHVEGFSVDVFNAATGSRTSTLAIDPEPVVSLVSVPPFYGLALTADGSKVVTGTLSMLQVYDVSSGRREHVIRPPQTGTSRWVESFALTDRIAAVGSSDGKVWVMTFPEGDLLRTIELPDRESVEAIALSPDGSRLSFFVDSVVHLVDLSDIAIGDQPSGA
ncbi:MAG: PDZ domain-containing protein, partial [Planctomycetota bacterium]